MTKLQKATDSGTPANPLRDSVEESEKGGTFLGGEATGSHSFAAGAGGISHFKSTAAGISGAGFGAESLFSAHGQDSSPSQQLAGCACVPHVFVDSEAKQDGTWESWIISPMSNAMIDLGFITLLRVKPVVEYSKGFYGGLPAGLLYGTDISAAEEGFNLAGHGGEK